MSKLADCLQLQLKCGIRLKRVYKATGPTALQLLTEKKDD